MYNCSLVIFANNNNWTEEVSLFIAGGLPIWIIVRGINSDYAYDSLLSIAIAKRISFNALMTNNFEISEFIIYDGGHSNTIIFDKMVSDKYIFLIDRR